jgi:hypothetical protein
MTKSRSIKKVLWTVAGGFVLWAVIWFVRPFFTNNDVGLSRLLYGWHDSRYAAFHRLFFEIERGMSRPDLEAVIRRIYPPEGTRTPPKFWEDKPTHITLFMDSENRPGPNCEGIFLEISNGTITGKGYGMD